jgi:hypothetical protein
VGNTPDFVRQDKYDCVLETQISHVEMLSEMDAVAADIIRAMNRDYERWLRDKGYTR